MAVLRLPHAHTTQAQTQSDASFTLLSKGVTISQNMDAPASAAGDGGGGGRRTSSSNRRRGSSWTKEEGNMTGQVLTRRRLLAFGGVAIVVGAIVGLAATKGGRQGAQVRISLAFAPCLT